jgi:hypothetical protein
MSEDPVKSLEAQVTLALAALGTAFAQTLEELDEYDEVIEILRHRAEGMRHHLEGYGAHGAAAMIGTFIGALYDKKLFPD